MSYEDRVMSQLVAIRNHLALLGHRVQVEHVDPLTMVGELESIQRRVERALLTPLDDPAPVTVQASRLKLVNRNQEETP